jgi:hypothetical protein
MVYKLEAVARDASGECWEFDFDGERYELPGDFDMRAAGALADGDLNGGLRLLMGDEQWDRLCQSNKVFGVRAMTDLLNAYCEGIGVDLGESVAPSRSSRRAVAPSKRTSNGSTGSTSRKRSTASQRG